uniref:Uncharacterized protein n=1 Tax=viral metagenome TaxID=1070528 RepID=A0A6M3XN08_9ZZZZ
MLAPCYLCQGTGVYKDESCLICDGNGEVDLNVADYIAYTISLNYRETGKIKSKINNLLDKCDDILDKCNDIFEKVNE